MKTAQKKATKIEPGKRYRVGLLCQTSDQFHSVRSAFKSRENLKNFEFIWMDCKATAQRLGKVIDFAAVYLPTKESKLSAAGRAAYLELENNSVEIKMSFFNIVKLEGDENK